MQIRFKNKYTMAIISMIEKGKALGGLPSVIELSVDEAIQLISEINTLRNDKDMSHSRFKITTGDRQNQVDGRLQLLGRELSAKERFDFVTEWTNERMFITFDNIPLQIIIVADKDKGYHD